MKFENKLIKGTLLKRYKRFLADIELDNGEVVIAHCPNTGAMTGCAEPGYKVWLSRSDNPKRKLAFTWELAVTNEGHWISINTHNANKVIGEALREHKLPELNGYRSISSEVKYGREGSRIDFLLKGYDGDAVEKKLADCYVEVKSVTLLQNNQGFFPDARTVRGQKHLRELTGMLKQGHRAVLLYCVQHSGIQSVRVAQYIDPDYAAELSIAIAAGLEVLCYSTKIAQEKIIINQRVPFVS
ncbi:MAG: sugar fermentation stimulation protein A [Paraglaciecola sp.]|jgi:sugar fermentation stimulation protein A